MPDRLKELFGDSTQQWVEEGPTLSFTEHYDPSEIDAKRHIRPVPLHKLFALDWWGVREGQTPVHPLGEEWYLTPFDIPNHTHIGFSIEVSMLG